MQEELTLAGRDPFVRGSTVDTSADDEGPFYPHLKKLHLGFPTYSEGTANCAQWAARAPNVTHIRLSGINWISPELVDDTVALVSLTVSTSGAY